MSSFFVEDCCALKENQKIRGIVDETWRDLDSDVSEHLEDWISHDGVNPAIYSRFQNSGQIPLGYAIVRFIEPYSGSALVHEDSLVLLDRSFSVGDVAKRQLSDLESGTVIRTAIECTLQPLYRYTGDVNPWPYKEEENLLFSIPGEELKYIEVLPEDSYIIYKDWVGWIEELFQEVAIRLEDGSIVVVQRAEDLEVQGSRAATEQDCYRSSNLSEILNQRLHDGQSKRARPAMNFYPGQRVTTKKANLRLGQWKFGHYKTSISPRGIVVEVRDVQVIVKWMTQNVFDPIKAQAEMPSSVLTVDEIEKGEIKLYSGKTPLSTDQKMPGAVMGSDISIGDFVRFKDLPGASVKYARESTEHEGRRQGILHQIPKSATMGYNMNVFMVKETRLKTSVQWQDGSVSIQEASTLVPYLNVDDHDVWPGEIVALKSDEFGRNTCLDKAQSEDAQDFIKAEEIGVVQSTNAKERIARVRWFQAPKVGIFDEQRSVLLPGSTLGELSNRETEVSYYEIVAYPALTKRRGDLVLIAPSAELLAFHSTQALQQAASNSYTIPATLHAMFGDSMGSFAAQGLATIRDRLLGTSNNLSETDWFGEIVDLGLDGLLTVRLGALDDVRDMKVPIERVIVVPGADDTVGNGSLDSGEEQDSYTTDSSASGMDYDSEDVIEEIVEYEGGMRLDSDGGDEMWMTDEEGSGPTLGAPPNDSSLESMETTNVLTTDSRFTETMDTSDTTMHLHTRAKEGNNVVFSETPMLDTLTEISSVLPKTLFSSYTNMPQQFVVLEKSPPSDHHFFNNSVQMSANLMRRIRKETRILESSLPDGVWIRSWIDRLDLIRVLIIGPRGTPYELVPFLIDFQFGRNFPISPPEAYFHSWTNGVGRINPNLYEDGKVCLSLLDTWPGDSKNEGWSAERSSMLQVVVSLMGLVLVQEPYYNEAGFDALIGSEEATVNSALYSERALVMAKGFLAHALWHEITGLEDVIEWIYKRTQEGPNLLQKVIDDSRNLLNVGHIETGNSLTTLNSQQQGRSATEANGKISSGARMLLRKHLSALEKYSDAVE